MRQREEVQTLSRKIAGKGHCHYCLIAVLQAIGKFYRGVIGQVSPDDPVIIFGAILPEINDVMTAR